MRRAGGGESLRGRLLVRLLVPMAVLVAVGAVGTFLLARYVGTTVYDRWLYDNAMTLAEQIEYRGGARFRLPQVAVEMFEWDSNDRMFYEVATRSGRRLFGNAPMPDLPASARTATPRFYDAVVDGRSVRLVSVLVPDEAVPNDPIVIRVAETTAKRRMLVAQILALGVPLQLLLLALVSCAVWYAVRSSLRTVDRVALEVASFEPDRLAPIGATDGAPSELRPLLAAVDSLIAKLAAAQAAEKRFTANAAHQLRTPLAALHVQTEVVLREPDPFRQREGLADLLTALGRLEHVVHQLLTLARAEPSEVAKRPLAPVDLAALARDVAEQWFDAAANRNVDLGYEGPDEGVIVAGDPHLLRELAGNLIDNAIRYGGAGASVTLSVSSDPPRLAIEDDGPGIALDERSLIFERFYRGADAQESGCGLGLAIAREIATRHEAEIRLDTPKGNIGTRLELTFVG